MLRIHFHVDDLVNTKLVTTFGPTVETVYAAKLLGHRAGGALFDRWRRLARVRSGRHARTYAQLADLVTLTSDMVDASPDVVRLPSSPGSTTEAGLREFHGVAVAPFWDRIRAHLEAERRARSEEIARAGLDHLLARLHPAVHWRLPVLEIPSADSRNLHLTGRGLRILPSLFRFHTPQLLVPRDPADPPTLVYPSAATGPAARSLWDATDDAALRALVGRTRAGLMRALDSSRTTTELSQRLGVTAAAVSQHTSVLRGAGLITSRRRQNTMWHSLTPLGLALVNQGSGVAGPQLAAAVS